MVQINFAQKTVNAKIVYYGPGMSGKTTNLEIVHQRAPSENRGDLTSISTDGDRTLFFDYMPLDLGTVAGMRTSFQLYTVPGQVYYNSTRKLVLQGVDGVIFVADSSAANLEATIESLRNLEENLNEYGKSLATMPHVIQYNKRDMPDALPVEELNAKLNLHGAPTFEAIASTGQGVFPTLKALAASVLKNLMPENGSRPAAAGAPEVSAPLPGARKPAPVAQPALATQSAPAAPAPTAQTAFQRQAAAPAARSAPALRPAPAARPGFQGAAAAPAQRPSSRPAVAQAAAAAPAASASHAAPAGKSRSQLLFTGAFIAIAIAAGALIARAVLNAL